MAVLVVNVQTDCVVISRKKATVIADRITKLSFRLKSQKLGSRVVSVLDSDAEGPGFKSQLRCCRVTVLGKLFTSIMPVFTKQQNWVTAGLVESNGSLPPGLLLTSPAG